MLRCYFSGVVVLFQIWSSLSGLFYFILFSRCGLPLVYVKVVELVCLSGGGCGGLPAEVAVAVSGAVVAGRR